MVRTRTFDPSTALTAAVDLFTSKGYSDTSMEDLVQATGVSRYGLYGTFGNKRELFEQALERYADNIGRRSFLRLLEPGASLDDIRTLFAERIGDMCSVDGRKGCLFIHTAMELAPKDKDLQDVLGKFMKRISKTFTIGLESARAQGQLREDLDLKAAGDMLTGTMFGLGVLGRSGFSRESLAAIVDSTVRSLEA